MWLKMQRDIQLAILYLMIMSSFITSNRWTWEKMSSGRKGRPRYRKLPYCPTDKRITAYLKRIKGSLSSRKSSKPTLVRVPRDMVSTIN